MGTLREGEAIPLLQSLDLANTEIPRYVCANQVLLTFPEKVRLCIRPRDQLFIENLTAKRAASLSS
jgi:hypothetical protein